MGVSCLCLGLQCSLQLSMSDLAFSMPKICLRLSSLEITLLFGELFGDGRQMHLQRSR